MNHTDANTRSIPSVNPLLETLAQPVSEGSILVVEDEGFVRDVTGEILEVAGYHVMKARNAAEAMTIFRQAEEKVLLLVTDVVLPGKSGRVLARELTALSPGLKILFISGYPDNVLTRDSSPDSKSSYLPKPFSVESLIRKVREALTENSLMPTPG